MPTIDDTVNSIINASGWDKRIARIRTIPLNHGTNVHSDIYAALARELYVPQLAPDYAYIHKSDFYELEYFIHAYNLAKTVTQSFSKHSIDDIAKAITEHPITMLVFRTITGLTKQEFAYSTELLSESLGIDAISSGKIDSMEQRNSAISPKQATLIANTVSSIMNGSLFGDPPGDVETKQHKPDTIDGWDSVTSVAENGVPYHVFLHQRHYGGAFRQVLDATSTKRGDIIEDAVEALFVENGVPFIRTGSHNQAEIMERFEVRVSPSPDFVVFDSADNLKAMLECKTINDGGTARDKALRFERLREESIRLGGIPLLAVLGGLGWKRVNDALGPVVRDTEGRVFTIKTLNQMMDVTPFPQLRGLIS
jgi:hypothetical protein